MEFHLVYSFLYHRETHGQDHKTVGRKAETRIKRTGRRTRPVFSQNGRKSQKFAERKKFRRTQNGAKLILWTNRVGDKLDAAVAWCREHGIEFDAVNENLPGIVQEFGGDCRKVYADQYIDDKAIRPEEAERQMRFRRTVRRGM